MKIHQFILVVLLSFCFLFNYGPSEGIIEMLTPEDSLKFAGITSLDLSQRNLNQIPENVHRYYNLEELDLSNNPFTILDPRLVNLKKLKKLKLNFCNNINVEQVMLLLNQLPIEELEINNSTIAHIPAELINCTKLKKLSLRNNYINKLPEDIAIYTRLQELDLANNQIDSLPETISAMKWLTKLDISNNQCLRNDNTCALVSTIENLEDLKADGISRLGNELGTIPNLRSLSVCNSEITSFPEGLVALRSIELNGCDRLNYDGFFKAIKKCDSLETLSLSSVSLYRIDNELAELKNLKSLQIKNNSLKNLPDNFQNLKTLKEVKMQLNTNVEQTSSIFKTLSQCENLTKLDLSYSSLNTLPDAISSLKNLKELNLEASNLKELPGGIYALQNLNTLNIKGNSLEQNSIFTLQDRLKNCDVINDAPYSVPSNLQKELLLTKESFILNPTKPNTITTIDGSVIRIPANAFVDDKGKLIKTDVTLNFQPFYSPSQIYLSGIPMNYDSGGVKNSFQSAGMFNITANANGKDLSLSKQKKIKIDFQSANPSRNYNFYSYDNTQKNWAYKGTDSIRPKPKSQSLSTPVNINYTLERMRPVAPPVRRDFSFAQHTTKVYFSIEEKKGRKKYDFWIERGYVSENISDEVQQYVNAKSHWTYESDSTGLDFFSRKPKDKNAIFYRPVGSKQKGHLYSVSAIQNKQFNIYVSPDKSKDRFNIVFKALNDSVILTGYPTYNSQLANKTQQITKKEYENYLVNSKKRRAEEEKQMLAYQKELKRFNKEMEEYRAWLKQKNGQEIASLNNMEVNQDRITRSLTLDGLGVWNCDIIQRLPNGQELYVRLYDSENKKVEARSITLIDQTNNGYGSFPTSKIIIDRFVNNVLIVNLDDNKFGYAKFSITNKNQTQVDLALNIIDSKKMTVKEFNEKVFN